MTNTKKTIALSNKFLAGLGCFLLLLVFSNGCKKAGPARAQGYVEGQYIYVASSLPGTLTALSVERGDQVQSGDSLFALDEVPEKAALDEARQRLAQARATLEDLQKGKRPTEIESLEAQLRQAQAKLALSEKEIERQSNLFSQGAVTAEALDQARSVCDQDRHRVQQIQADLETARLGARNDQIDAARANVQSLEAALAQSQWALDQKTQFAPKAGLIFDTLFRPGEWVPAGRPVVVLLPPGYIKVRAFVSETLLGGLHVGDSVQVFVDGAAEPSPGRMSFISPKAEFTPPVIYSRESREKLVFLVEIVFEPEIAARLHPGQPVDVQLGAQDHGGTGN
jgi:HlyD family secretion protein